MTIYKLVDRAGEPYEEHVLGWFLHAERAERALRELGPRQLRDTMLDGSARYAIEAFEINDEAQ
jgi:hypothetical protein